MKRSDSGATKVDLVKAATVVAVGEKPKLSWRERRKAAKKVVLPPKETEDEPWVMPALPRKPRLADLRDRRGRARRALAFRSLGYLGIALIIAGVSFPAGAADPSPGHRRANPAGAAAEPVHSGPGRPGPEHRPDPVGRPAGQHPGRQHHPDQPAAPRTVRGPSR
ncbi:hypothetical protein [Fodinicola feengrottensis]|uniref:hypothetical protein n=1 Tax=Fodinicola feengrottensis TaxID=435914 RepID=UPI0013D8983E|nr:hypothetical protein [Fodinicola feengrottensis]